MVLVGSRLQICDNSGGLDGKCIRVFKKRSDEHVGCNVMVSIKSISRVSSKFNVIVGQLSKAVVVRTNKRFFIFGGHSGWCCSTAIVLLKADNDIACTRINGPVGSVLRRKGFSKLLSISRFIY